MIPEEIKNELEEVSDKLFLAIQYLATGEANLKGYPYTDVELRLTIQHLTSMLASVHY